MRKRTLISTAIALIALSFTLLLPAASRADDFNLAMAGGSFVTKGSYQATSFDVYAYSMYLSAYGFGMTGGSVSVHNDTMWINAEVGSVSCTPTHAVVTSVPFTYYDYYHWQVYQATLVVTLSLHGSMGDGGYRIVRSDNGAVVDQTSTIGIDLNGAHPYAEYGFTGVPVTIWKF